MAKIFKSIGNPIFPWPEAEDNVDSWIAITSHLPLRCSIWICIAWLAQLVARGWASQLEAS